MFLTYATRNHKNKYLAYYCVVDVRLQALRNSAFNMWRQEETSSLRLLSVACISQAGRMKIYFFNNHRLQGLFDVLYGLALASIFQEMVCSMFLSFNVQISLLKYR